MSEMQFLVDPDLKPYRIDLFTFALGQDGSDEINIIDNDEEKYLEEMEQLDLRQANFIY